MVEKYSKRGLYEWIAQRVTAVVVLVYFVVLLSYFCSVSHPIRYDAWLSFHSQIYIRILTVLAVFSILWHAWIGIWTVLTDYVKPACIRLLLQILVLLFLAVCGIWIIILMCG